MLTSGGAHVQERVERIFYPLPVTWIPGGALDRPFEEMYDTEREDPDKKNQVQLSARWSSSFS